MPNGLTNIQQNCSEMRITLTVARVRRTCISLLHATVRRPRHWVKDKYKLCQTDDDHNSSLHTLVASACQS